MCPLTANEVPQWAWVPRSLSALPSAFPPLTLCLARLDPGPRSQPVPGLSPSCSDSLTTPWWEIKSKSNLWDCPWIDSAKYPLLQLRDELWYTLNCISKTVGTRCMVCLFLVSEFMVHMLYIRGPQPPGHGPVPPVRSGRH